MAAKSETRIFEQTIATQDGVFHARYSDKGLCALEFPFSRRMQEPKNETDLPAPVRSWHKLTVEALSQALTGMVPKCLPPLDLSSGTPFQIRVWETMRGIGPGNTLSYSEVAKSIGNRNAVRAVGQACGANPIPVFVPCHRVLAAKQRLGGFSGWTGLETQAVPARGRAVGCAKDRQVASRVNAPRLWFPAPC
jgi:O-6-methylguanine DNA methyltransferase